MRSTDWLDQPDLMLLLREGELAVEGRVAEASNATLRCRISDDADRVLTCVYKPVAGERPLWDFPQWTLTERELAAHALSETLGWGLVPPTVWRDEGPGGPGMCQLWIDEVAGSSPVTVVRPGSAPDGWCHVLDAEDGAGDPLELIHADAEILQRVALFDALANNADRKGGHLLTDPQGRIWAIDHGVTFAVEEKLRTVLWGWAGEPLPAWAIDELGQLAGTLAGTHDAIDRWLGDAERDVLRRRLHGLVQSAVFPSPSMRWPAIPWPVF